MQKLPRRASLTGRDVAQLDFRLLRETIGPDERRKDSAPDKLSFACRVATPFGGSTAAPLPGLHAIDRHASPSTARHPATRIRTTVTDRVERHRRQPGATPHLTSDWNARALRLAGGSPFRGTAACSLSQIRIFWRCSGTPSSSEFSTGQVAVYDDGDEERSEAHVHESRAEEQDGSTALRRFAEAAP